MEPDPESLSVPLEVLPSDMLAPVGSVVETVSNGFLGVQAARTMALEMIAPERIPVIFMLVPRVNGVADEADGQLGLGSSVPSLCSGPMLKTAPCEVFAP